MAFQCFGAAVFQKRKLTDGKLDVRRTALPEAADDDVPAARRRHQELERSHSENQGRRQFEADARQTIYRNVKDGTLSATVGTNGEKVVDTAELHRAFGRLTPVTGETVTPRDSVLQHEIGPATGQAPPASALASASARCCRRRFEDKTAIESIAY